MATTSDIRDIMDMGHDGARQPAAKKKRKQSEAQPRLTGISREVQALMGDSVPPVAIVETPRYKSKPSVMTKMFKVRHWGDREFVHGARTDGLQLRHWKRAIPGPIGRAPAVTNGSPDVEMVDGDKDEAVDVRFEDEFPAEKWNVKIPIPVYTDEQYEKNFVSEDWTKEETDYLMEVCRDYDTRWIIVTDRYDPANISSQMQPDTKDDSPTKTYPQRTMESLKARYYTIASKMLEVQTPASQMTGEEFQLWERMRNFDAKTEANRKMMAEKLFERTKEEADEEKVLLEELYRITKHEEDFIKMRKDLYSRLETAPSLKRNERGDEQSTAVYQTSQGLSHLLSTLLAREKRLKRPQANGTDATSTAATPTDTKGRHPTYNRRETMESQADEGGPSKKGSVSQPVIRTLTSAEEVKYGVSHPQERLTSGVMFRHEKINRITTAKSQVQTQKIQAALTELGIPARLLMPTERVCREFERLVAEVQILLDTRRVSEKVATEVKILEEHKRIRLGQPKEGEDANTNGDSMDVDESVAPEDQNENDQTKVEEGDESLMPNGDDNEKEDDEEDEEGNGDQSGAEDEDEQTFSRRRNEDDDNAGDEEDEQEEQDEEEDEDDDDAPGLEDLERANQVTDDEEENDENAEVGDSEAEDEEEENQEDEEDNDEDEDEAGDQGPDQSAVNGDDDDEEEEDEEASVEPTAQQAPARSHKRSASVLSDGSKAGSTVGRKKRR